MSQPETRHLPMPDPETGPYWDAAREHRLLIRRCHACERAHHYPRARCPFCFSDDVDWEESAGRGTVHTHTTVWQNHARPFRDRLPYVVALVDLDEGPRVMTNIEVDDVGDVQIGQRVRVTFREEPDDVHLPVFVPAEEEA